MGLQSGHGAIIAFGKQEIRTLGLRSRGRHRCFHFNTVQPFHRLALQDCRGLEAEKGVWWRTRNGFREATHGDLLQ